MCLEHLAAAQSSEEWTAARLSALVAFILSFLAGGFDISRHALEDLLKRRVTIDLLMILAAIGAALIGEWAEGGVLLFLFSLSHALESYVLGRTRRAIRELMQVTPDRALVLRQGQEMMIDVNHLEVGDIVVVRPSDRIAADGTVTTGRTAVDQSPMTGESIPVDKHVGDPIFAGTLNLQGSIQFRVEKTASETKLARMVKLVEQAQSERASSQQFTEWFGQSYTWLVLSGSTIVLLAGWLGFGEEFSAAFYRAMTVLVVASPCAVVISIPAAILAAISSAARGGVLFKGGTYLELAADLKMMAFDKTGTLTLGRPKLIEIIPVQGVSETELLRAAAALEKHSEHPLGVAVVEAAVARKIEIPEATGVEAIVSRGIIGQWNGQSLRVGKLSWFQNDGLLAEPLAIRAASIQESGKTVICVGSQTEVWGLLVVADTLRPTAAATIQELHRLGITPLVLLSGDHPTVVARIAGELKMEFQGGLLPEDKLRLIESLRQQHGAIGMIGDGMNDAPSLAAANVGFSLGGAGTDVALETADIVILADDLRRLPYAIALARRTQQIIRQNLVLAFSVMGALLIAALITPLPLPLAVVFHEGSTVAVILNGLRLLAFPKPEPFISSAVQSP